MSTTLAPTESLQSALAGRYTIERELGRGGMGVVYLARDLVLDRLVAIKLLPPMLSAQPELRERFLRETRTAAGLSHPNIVPIHAIEERDGLVYFVMGYIDGETLSERVQRAGPMPSGEAARMLQEAGWALSYAHGRGIVHRDVKADNILLERASGRAFITDFGIARLANSTMTQVGESLGTPQYMSPEQATGEPVDARSDLYSLGIVGFFALTGRLPFEAPTTQAILAMQVTKPATPVAQQRPDVPKRLADAIDKCLLKNADDRWPSAEAFVSAIQTVQGSTAVEIAPPVRNFQRMAEAHPDALGRRDRIRGAPARAGPRARRGGLGQARLRARAARHAPRRWTLGAGHAPRAEALARLRSPDGPHPRRGWTLGGRRADGESPAAAPPHPERRRAAGGRGARHRGRESAGRGAGRSEVERTVSRAQPSRAGGHR